MEINGLPVHILLLHLVVVLGPVMGLVALAWTVRPVWRRMLSWPLLVGAVLTAVAALVTAHFGEELQHAMPHSDAIAAHAQLGDACKAVALVFLVLAVVAVARHDDRFTAPGRLSWARRIRTVSWLGPVSHVLLALAGVALVVATVLAGHSGATAAWADWRRR